MYPPLITCKSKVVDKHLQMQVEFWLNQGHFVGIQNNKHMVLCIAIKKNQVNSGLIHIYNNVNFDFEMY